MLLIWKQWWMYLNPLLMKLAVLVFDRMNVCIVLIANFIDEWRSKWLRFSRDLFIDGVFFTNWFISNRRVYMHILWQERWQLMKLFHLIISIALLHFNFLSEQHNTHNISNLYTALWYSVTNLPLVCLGQWKFQTTKWKILLHTANIGVIGYFSKDNLTIFSFG